MPAYRDRSENAPLPDLSGLALRVLADAARLPAEDRSALAEALRRLRSADAAAPAVLMHAEQP